ncbi:MAG: HlyC/CorC family transporter [Alphaproteobacteria bacterium]|jgi:magnesium and cobalt transporter|nr:HlyC/CorC family transporter [Alphaproteobacteria bacterium]
MNDGSTKPVPSGARGQGGFLEALRDLFGGWPVRAKPSEPTALETLEELIEEREENEEPLDAHERRLLGNVLRLRGVTAYDVMIPRADIVGVPSQIPLDELLETFTREGHSRMPVYRGTLDDTVGMVHIKDVLAVQTSGQTSGQPFQLGRIIRRVLFVAPAMRALDLLLEMRIKRIHLAMVVDEYGGIDGLITIEDLVEQIVGEIEDEHDELNAPDIVKRSDGSYEADARAPLEALEEITGPVLTKEERGDIDTLGGLVIALAGHVPARGELIQHGSGLEFEVVEADPRRVRRLRLRNLPSLDATEPQDS